jgi:hypothetical protein
MFWIFFDVKNLIGCVICNGSFNPFLFYVSKILICGSSFSLNVFYKCPAKVFAFCLSLRAHVWSASMAGGMHCMGCFKRLVTFQSEYPVSAVAVKL